MCPNFAATRLSTGFRNDSKFLSPTLHAETVAEEIFKKIMKAESGFVVLPKTHAWLAMMIRSYPYWIQRGLSQKLKDTMRDVEKETQEAALKASEKATEIVSGGVESAMP